MNTKFYSNTTYVETGDLPVHVPEPTGGWHATYPMPTVTNDLSNRCDRILLTFVQRMLRRNDNLSAVMRGDYRVNSFELYENLTHVGTVSTGYTRGATNLYLSCPFNKDSTKRTSKMDVALEWAEQYMRRPPLRKQAQNIMEPFTSAVYNYASRAERRLTMDFQRYAYAISAMALGEPGVQPFPGYDKFVEVFREAQAFAYIVAQPRPPLLFVVYPEPGEPWCMRSNQQIGDIEPFDLNKMPAEVRGAYAMLSALPADKLANIPGMGVRMPEGIAIALSADAAAMLSEKQVSK